MSEQTQILPHSVHRTFISLRNPNFRLYFAAQIGSNIGAWVQITAENWLVLQLTPTLPSPASGGGLRRGLALESRTRFNLGHSCFSAFMAASLPTGSTAAVC
jgi:hypothetical protein